jgi:hypothetical protein
MADRDDYSRRDAGRRTGRNAGRDQRSEDYTFELLNPGTWYRGVFGVGTETRGRSMARSMGSRDTSYGPEETDDYRQRSRRGHRAESTDQGELPPPVMRERHFYRTFESNANFDLPSAHPERPREDYIGRGPKGFRRSDERIRENVSEALYYHKDIDASDIEVHVKNAVVTLSGSVENRFQKYLAEDVVDSIPGVGEIRNDISVKKSALRPPPGYHWV